MCTHPRGCFIYDEHCSMTYHRWISNLPVSCMWDFLGDSVVKNLPANAADKGSTPGSGRSLREGNCNPCQYSCLGNPMDRGAQQATVHGVTELFRHDWETKQPMHVENGLEDKAFHNLSLSLLLTLFCSLSPFLPFVSRVTLGKLLSPAQCLSLTICKMGMIAVPTS